jgi:predicted dienelactone hydrolase
MIRHTFAALLALVVTVASPAAPPPSVPPVDAPELAALGPAAVGVRTVTIVHANQPDVLAVDRATGLVPTRDRPLVVDVWYPAVPTKDARPETYVGALPAEPPAPAARFTVPGLAVRDAVPQKGRHPLVVVSHGYSNVTVALSWLTENLASKGYVVAAIRHEDPMIGDRSTFAGPLFNRPLDIAHVTRALAADLAHEGIVDAGRVALVGYSMGGYGVLTSAGATLDPAGPANLVPGGAMLPYTRGHEHMADVVAPNVKAVVALAPAGGGTLQVWGKDGLRDLKAPLLLIAGDHDFTVDYASGARAFFEQAVHAQRYLLTFQGGGHGIGLDPVPDDMRGTLWDFSWFEDPVWRKDKIIAVNLHMITAFLDRYVKDDASRASYLDGLVPRTNDAVWPADLAPHFDMQSPGTSPITLWKGFKRHFATNLEWLAADPSP